MPPILIWSYVNFVHSSSISLRLETIYLKFIFVSGMQMVRKTLKPDTLDGMFIVQIKTESIYKYRHRRAFLLSDAGILGFM